MEELQNIDPVSMMALLAACAIIVLALFTKVVRGMLKIAVITAMIACILYFLRLEGLI